MTPLMLAAQKGDLELVRALLAHGADPGKLDYAGHDAANWAADGHHLAVVRALTRALAARRSRPVHAEWLNGRAAKLTKIRWCLSLN
jgi:ankyrin repeat protein